MIPATPRPDGAYLDHGAGVSSAYLHLSQQLVTTGDTVQRGQVIGRVGATGRVTGPHLHFIVRYGSVTVDPLSLLDCANAGTAPKHIATTVTMPACASLYEVLIRFSSGKWQA